MFFQLGWTGYGLTPLLTVLVKRYLLPPPPLLVASESEEEQLIQEVK